MSLLALLLVLGLIVAGAVAMMPQAKPVPLAGFKAQAGARFAAFELLPDNKYVLKVTQDGNIAASDDGTSRIDGRMGEDGTQIFLTAADGVARTLIFERGTAWCHTETETCPPARSVKDMNFRRAF